MRFFLSAVVILLCLGNRVEAETLGEQPFFKSIAGNWVGDGELKNADGEVTKIHEEWIAAVTDDGGFSLEGTRLWGEEEQQFRWVFSVNAATELFECEYQHTGMDEPAIFEVQLADDHIELKTAMGDGELTVRNELKGKKIEGNISLLDSMGNENLGGKVVHERQE